MEGPQPFSELSEASLVLLTPPEGELASDTVARIREQLPRTGVIVLTGWGSTTEAVDCFKAGAMDYVERPVSSERLVNIVSESWIDCRCWFLRNQQPLKIRLLCWVPMPR